MALPDGVQQHLVAEWLRQELDGSRLHGLDRHRHVAVAGDEDDRHVDPVGGDALLQIETVEVRKIDVQHQAARGEDRVAETRNSCADANVSGCQPALVDQQFQRFAHRDVVVDNEHDWRRRMAWAMILDCQPTCAH